MSCLWVDYVQEQVKVLDRQLEYFDRKQLEEFLPSCRSIYVWRDALDVWVGAPPSLPRDI